MTQKRSARNKSLGQQKRHYRTIQVSSRKVTYNN